MRHITNIETKDKFKEAFDSLKRILDDEISLPREYYVDKRSMAVAITNLETASMWAVRSLFTEQARKEN